ncbi:DUF2062 domain-containing protein [Dongshaea marina]|uniref:DUF2062 domain-containing protein n=1 Tax=Dongshaea marina TaxID=2047966 RepID=UPI000D3E4BE2|nr:DUF2062 domain-containing protein [Dongshaea marina]
MPKKMFRRFMPDPKQLRKHKHLKIFGALLHDANLWHLNRRSAAGAFAVGLFMAWMPIPCQMLFAAGAAILFRVNLPISVALVWISNPITMPPLFYAAYVLGAKLTGLSIPADQGDLTWQWLLSAMGTVGPAFLLGCFIFAILSSSIGYFFVRLLWRYSILRDWNKRKLRRSQQQKH